MFLFIVLILFLNCALAVISPIELLERYQNLTENFKTNFYGLSEDCNNAYYYLFDKQKIWTFIDAGSKQAIPNGLSAGNGFDLGIFDLCYGHSVTTNDSKEIFGKYCLGTNILVPGSIIDQLLSFLQNIPTSRMIGNNPTSVGIHLSYCVPHVCSMSDITKLVNALSAIPTTTFNENYCYTKQLVPGYSIGAILTIAILGLLFILMILSTVYDVIVYYFNLELKHEIYLAFSCLANGRKLLKSSSNPDQLGCLNGLKSISMAWVILGHEYTLFVNSPIVNSVDVFKVLLDKDNMWLLSAPLSVDTFFMIGGLVTMYTFLKSHQKGIQFNIITYYIHRWLRLTPALAIIILIHVNLISYLGNGPFWITCETLLVQECKSNWLAALFYMQNYIWSNCVPQSWYLSVDMQLFLLSPIVLIPLVRWPCLAYGLLTIFFIGGFVVPFLVTYFLELPAFLVAGTAILKISDYMFYYYKATYCRFGPYIIGMIFGIIVFNMKTEKWPTKKTKRNNLIATFLWLLSFATLWTCLYSGAELLTASYNATNVAIYNSFHRNIWAIALGLIISLCISGFGGPVDVFLSIPLFQFLAKVSYAMYLVHYAFIQVRFSSKRDLTTFSHFFLMHTFWGDYMYCLVLGIVLCLMFESPTIVLERTLFKYLKSNFVQRSTARKAIKGNKGST